MIWPLLCDLGFNFLIKGEVGLDQERQISALRPEPAHFLFLAYCLGLLSVATAQLSRGGDRTVFEPKTFTFPTLFRKNLPTPGLDHLNIRASKADFA